VLAILTFRKWCEQGTGLIGTSRVDLNAKRHIAGKRRKRTLLGGWAEALPVEQIRNACIFQDSLGSGQLHGIAAFEDSNQLEIFRHGFHFSLHRAGRLLADAAERQSRAAEDSRSGAPTVHNRVLVFKKSHHFPPRKALPLVLRKTMPCQYLYEVGHHMKTHAPRLFSAAWLLLAAGLSCAQPAPPAQAAPRERILFVGNSYTYVNHLPAVLEQLANSVQPGSLEAKMVVVGGATLKNLWEKGDALKAIQQGGWTYVVLQEQSTLGPGRVENGIPQINDPAMFFEYARRFDAEIRKAGAKTAFYMTWARRDSPQNQARLTAAYTSIAKELGAVLVPAGSAWEISLHERPSLALHQADNSHPTPAGTYLAACVFYAVLLQRNPAGLPAHVTGKPVDMTGRVLEAESHGITSSPATVALIDLRPEDAHFLQTAAWKSIPEESRKRIRP